MLFYTWDIAVNISRPTTASDGGPHCVRDVSSYLVANEVNGVVGVAVLEQEIRVDRSGHDARLQPAEASELGVARGDRPQGHGIEEVDVFGR